MKKMSLFAGAILGLALAANAQLMGVGYNSSLSQITARLGLSGNMLDVGFGMKFDNTDDNNDDNNFAMGVSGTFLGHLHDWGPVDTYFAGGLVVQKLPQANDNIGINLFAGFQPEVTLLDHIAVSTRFGLDVPVAPNVILQTAGAGISIIGGANFTILF
jgi:hypothetical protein